MQGAGLMKLMNDRFLISGRRGVFWRIVTRALCPTRWIFSKRLTALFRVLGSGVASPFGACLNLSTADEIGKTSERLIEEPS
jgi:hypothetical protein